MTVRKNDEEQNQQVTIIKLLMIFATGGTLSIFFKRTFQTVSEGRVFFPVHFLLFMDINYQYT